MTVNELIEKLNKCNSDAVIMVLSNFNLQQLRSVEQINNVDKLGSGIQLVKDEHKSIVLLA